MSKQNGKKDDPPSTPPPAPTPAPTPQPSPANGGNTNGGNTPKDGDVENIFEPGTNRPAVNIRHGSDLAKPERHGGLLFSKLSILFHVQVQVEHSAKYQLTVSCCLT
ncbi:hypothetical protein FOXB_00597 [Fusarium oxysporum f. sp. conglutinans Fo5176]|uniref:Uncharacterized protein n=2 Tax=Fusarium oxysporum f. sp. conglutinans TaxID=100902 RepID=F9F2H3_FUSOF|nr:hypothetical protein FOXB_00597 [Fusarium oxysporum f. sp. conglutinans Fo5176]